MASYRFERECRTPSSEAYNIFDEERPCPMLWSVVLMPGGSEVQFDFRPVPTFGRWLGLRGEPSALG